MKEKAFSVIKILGIVMILILMTAAVQRLLMPKYASDIPEGSLIDDFYAESRHDYDVLFLGDCEVYENISAVTLWEEYGINSFIRGSAQQTVWQSYYLLEDTLRFSKPSVVVFNVLALIYDEPQSEAYNRMTLDGMQWSPAKSAAVHASMTEGENYLSYLFPILRYHDRWNELTTDDLTYFWNDPIRSYNGYLMQKGIKPAENVPTGRVLGEYDFGANAMSYLEKMRQLCEEKGISLILIKAPSLYPYWYDEYEAQVIQYAKENNLSYINYLKLQEETGIDYQTDTYDAGLHLNVFGAEKLAGVLGKTLSEDYGILDRRNEEELAALWEIKVERYMSERDVPE